MVKLFFLVIQSFRILELARPNPSDFLFMAWKRKTIFHTIQIQITFSVWMNPLLT